MKLKVMISAPYMQPVIERFRPIFESRGIELIIPEVNERMEEEDLLRYVGDLDGVICGDDRFTPRVLDAAPKLKVVSKWGTGIDSIDKPACEARGIAVCNTPNAFTIPVSDSIMAYMLCFARRTPWMNEAMHQGEWKKIPGRSLSECTLGVVGVGNIGTAVIKKASAFGMRILAIDPKGISEELQQQTGVMPVALKEVLSEADFVAVCTDLNPSSYRIINAETLSWMKPSAVLINAARGPLVHEEALIKALQDGKLAGAALDVFEHEPLPQDSPLKGMSNVLMAPHNSNSSPRAWEHIHRSTTNNLLRVLGKPLMD
jgi:D-3-phosphoglycerate dehydrogenase